MSQPDELMMQTLDLATLGKAQDGVKYSSDLLRRIGQTIDKYELQLRPALVDEKHVMDLGEFKKSVVIRADLGYVLQKFPEYYSAFLKKEGKPAVIIKVNFGLCCINICNDKEEVQQYIGFEVRNTK